MNDKSNYIRKGLDLVLLFFILLVGWTLNAEIFHLGGVELQKKERRLNLVLTSADLGADRWQIGAINLKEDQGIYQVNIVDENSQELFKLALDAETGELTEKNRLNPPKSPLPIDEVRRRVAPLLPRMMVGEVFQKRGKAFAQATLLLDNSPLARIKVDPMSGQPYNPSATSKEGRYGKKKMMKWIPEDLIMPLGWIGTTITVLAVLYYYWRRSLLTQLKIAEEGKQQAAAILKQTLNNHGWMSLTALAIILAHSFNSLGKSQLSLSWLALAMVVTISGSGLFRKYRIHNKLLQTEWRRFHVRLVTLFFAVVAIHALQKIGLL